MKTAALSGLLLFSLAAQPASQPASSPAPFDSRVFAAALTGTYHDEDGLLRMARDDSAPGFNQLLAITAAVCNEWNGPFRLRDFAAWLHDNKLDARVAVTDLLGDAHDSRFTHLPKGFRKMVVYLVGKDPSLPQHDFAVIAVGEQLSEDDVMRVLRSPTDAGTGNGPIIYDIRSVIWPVGMIPNQGEE
jgi:hypothetical protein